MDTRQWRRAGYLPASEIARVFSVPPITLHRWMDKGHLPFSRQGRYRFVHLDTLVDYVRRIYTDKVVAQVLIKAFREAVKIRHDPGAKRCG
jgi:hypothetical protein